MDNTQPWPSLLALPVTEAALNAGEPAGGAPAPPLDEAGCPAAVPRFHASELSYERFCLEFMAPNLPAVIQGATEGWQAARDWVGPDGGINVQFFERRFGASLVTATDAARMHEGSGPCQQMSLQQYLAWWRQHEQQAAPDPAGSEPLWYCKDWHLASEFPDYQAYSCPALFQDDWLNEWLDSRQPSTPRSAEGQEEPQQQAASACPAASGSVGSGGQQAPPGAQERQSQDVATRDYRFTYLGPKGTSTPLHADVLRSFSWSANFSHLLLDRAGRTTPWDFDAADAEGLYPQLAEAQQHLLTVVQEAGEAIFVPSGWFHTVENLDDCASINHNWLNGHNAHWAWALLRQERRQAEQGIEDCRQLCGPAEFEGLVQRNLAANAGLDYAGLGAMLRCIAQRSLRQLQALPGPGCYCAGQAAGAGVGCWRCSPGYHAFRLQRAAAMLRQLVAEQRQIDAGGAAPQQAEAPYHAAEVAASEACLVRVEEQLRALGVGQPQ